MAICFTNEIHRIVQPDFELTEKNTEEFGFGHLWERFFPYWPLLVIITIFSTGVAWLYLENKSPLYEASAAVLIKDEKKGVDVSKMVQGFNQLSDTKIIENEIEIISSRSMLTEVANYLCLYAPVYQDSKWRPLLAYASSPVKIELSDPSSLTETPKVYFSFSKKDNTVILDEKSIALNEWTETKYGTVRFLKNENYKASTQTEFYFSLIDPKRVTKELSKRLQTSSINKQSTVIVLKVQDEAPQRAEDILNVLIHSYGKAAIKDKNILADSTLAFLGERLKEVATELDSIEKKMQLYKATKDAIDIGAQGRLFLENVSSNDRKAAELNMQLAVLDEVETYVRSKSSDSEIIPSGLVVNDPILNQRLEKLYMAEMEYEKLKKNTAENNPLLVSVINQVEKLRSGILESISNQKNSLKAGKRNLDATNDKYNSLLQAVPQKERDLIEISREQILKTNLYNFLSQKKEEIALSHSSVVTDSRIVDKAEASLEPVSPDKKTIYLLAIALAVITFFALITFRETLNKSILYRQEIERITEVPILAEIPFKKGKKTIVINEEHTSFAGEQFRKLRNSLGYLGIGSRRKKILITSVISNEGKSFVALNLGMSLALTGKKVILVEFDLVNPSLSEKFDLPNERGLTGYLAGIAETEEIIKRTEINKNLFIIPAGKASNSPGELLISNRTEDLLNYLENIFDYIILDTAPVGLRADAYALSRFCDATLYIVRHNRTPKKSLKRLDENNKIDELKNMAIIFNGVKPKGFSRSTYGYTEKYTDEKKKKKQVAITTSDIGL